MEGDDPRFVRVVCPKCRAVLHPRVERAGRHVRCPDCYSAVLVPRPPAPEATPKRRDPGEYNVREALAPARSESSDADFFPTLCPKCQARLHPRRKHVGRRARCPDCDTVFVVPPPPAPEKAPVLPKPGKYAMGELANRVEPEFRYLTVDREAEHEPEPAAPPARGWCFRGVFDFPWWPGAWARWTILSLLMLPALGLTGFILLLAHGGLNQVTTVVPYLMLPLMWLWVWALSYAAGCFVAIVQDTGSGNDEVAGWPEGDWRERIGTMLYIGLHLGLSLAAAATVAWPLGKVSEPLWGALTAALATNLLFPLFLLSSMEAATPLTPYSSVILGSLLQTPGGWLVVYLESALLLLAGGGAFGAALYLSPIIAIPLVAPLLATVIFIEARLYGRLAWHIGQLPTKRRKGRKRKSV